MGSRGRCRRSFLLRITDGGSRIAFLKLILLQLCRALQLS